MTGFSTTPINPETGTHSSGQNSEERSGGRSVPGSKASTVHPSSWWKSSFRLVSRHGGRLGQFLRSFFRKPATPQYRSTAQLWPMPLPYPTAVSSGEDLSEEAGFRRAVNLIVLALNWLHLRRPLCCPPEICVGAALNKLQWRVVRNVERLLSAWKSCEAVTPQAMGRTASKVEDLEGVLFRLQSFQDQVFDSLDDLLPGRSGGDASRRLFAPLGFASGLQRSSAGDVCGNVQCSALSFAKNIEASRLNFRGEPVFDPLPYLDDRNKRVYASPITSAMDPSESLQDPPVVRIHASEEEKWSLFRKLDAAGRLGVVKASAVLPGYQSGLFAVPKDADADRLIFDSRPFNCLECGSSAWVGSMASSMNLLDLQLRPEHSCMVSGTDLRDFYYAFKIGPERLIRNTLIGPVEPSKLKGFRCYDSTLEDAGPVFLSLNSLAMGDSHAVEIAQVAHLSLLVQSGVIRKEELITMNMGLPRTPYMGGVVIDDLVLFEVVLRSEFSASPSDSYSGRQLQRAIQQYESVGLVPHPSKTFIGKSKAEFWGCYFDGETGLVGGSLKRAVPTIFITLGILKLGFCSIGLLEVVIGCWTALFLYRRRLLSLLNVCYEALQRGLSRADVIRISGELREELFLCVILGPLAVTDIRIDVCDWLFASDASDWGIGITRSLMPPWLSSEIHRHKLNKGAWTKLLSPVRALLRLKGALPAADELPEGKVLSSHPLWLELACCLPFEEVLREKVRRAVHINVSEMRAMLRVEREISRLSFPCRYFSLSDSQVCLGAILKGRSASAALNQELQQSLPVHLGCGLVNSHGYVPSELNSADDPTRHCDVRLPVKPKPSWLESEEEELAKDGLDTWLESYKCGSYEVSGLPPFEELYGEVETLHVENSREKRKQYFRKKCSLRSASLKQEAVETDIARSTPVSSVSSTQKISDRSSGPGSSESCLSPRALAAFNRIPKKQLIIAGGKVGVESFVPSRPGYLDLYSGEKGVAKSFVSQGGEWAVTFETDDSEDQDVMSSFNQQLIHDLIDTKCVVGVGAGIFCSSFSRAVRPMVRSRDSPAGLEGISHNMEVKVGLGNRHSLWLSGVIELCKERGIHWWVENPDSSFLWLMPEWETLGSTAYENSLRIDYCRVNCPWRKRTRFLTDLHLRNQSLFCLRDHQHIRLVGWSRTHRMPWTRAAQSYPRQLCAWISAALLIDSGLLPKRRKINLSLICGANHGRVGEASNPGPRRKGQIKKRDIDLLDNTLLVRPGTHALGERIWFGFQRWALRQISEEAFLALSSSPETLSELIVLFGRQLYGDGQSLYLLRQLITFVQRAHPSWRSRLGTAWQLVGRWESLEPNAHRAPMPYVVYQALFVFGLLKGWLHWTGVLCLMFEGICRPGEVINASRSDLLLPKDLVVENPHAVYLRIGRPKPGRRGIGLVQHTKITTPGVANFLTKVFGRVKRSDRLWDGSASAFRTRWDFALKTLGVPLNIGLVPASLRGGGAVKSYRLDEDIHGLMWKMRLKSIETLRHYLQEVGADSTFAELSTNTRHVIQRFCSIYPLLLDGVTTFS